MEDSPGDFVDVEGVIWPVSVWLVPALHANYVLLCDRVMYVECGWPVFPGFVWWVFVSFKPCDLLSYITHPHGLVNVVNGPFCGL